MGYGLPSSGLYIWTCFLTLFGYCLQRCCSSGGLWDPLSLLVIVTVLSPNPTDFIYSFLYCPLYLPSSPFRFPFTVSVIQCHNHAAQSAVTTTITAITTKFIYWHPVVGLLLLNLGPDRGWSLYWFGWAHFSSWGCVSWGDGWLAPADQLG